MTVHCRIVHAVHADIVGNVILEVPTTVSPACYTNARYLPCFVSITEYGILRFHSLIVSVDRGRVC